MIYIHGWRENLSAGDQSGLANGPGDYPVYGARVPQYDNILFIPTSSIYGSRANKTCSFYNTRYDEIILYFIFVSGEVYLHCKHIPIIL